jgi:hypothetical protein
MNMAAPIDKVVLSSYYEPKMHSLYLYHDTYNGFEETKWFVLDKQ